MTEVVVVQAHRIRQESSGWVKIMQIQIQWLPYPLCHTLFNLLLSVGDKWNHLTLHLSSDPACPHLNAFAKSLPALFPWVYYRVSQWFHLSTTNHLKLSSSRQLSERNLSGSLPSLEQAPNCLDKNWPPLVSVFLYWLSYDMCLPFTLLWLPSYRLNIDSLPCWPGHCWSRGQVKYLERWQWYIFFFFLRSC